MYLWICYMTEGFLLNYLEKDVHQECELIHGTVIP